MRIQQQEARSCSNMVVVLLAVGGACSVLLFAASSNLWLSPRALFNGRDPTCTPVSTDNFVILPATHLLYQKLPSIYRPKDDDSGCRMVIPDRLITQPIVAEPSDKLPLCTVLSIEYLGHQDLIQYYQALGAGYRAQSLHRKAWEWAMGLRVLHELGSITEDAQGLSLAAGHEPVHYYLSNHIKMMYASDMYGVGGFAADGTAAKSILDNPADYAPTGVAWRADHLKLLWQNARNLSYFGDESLDFVISFGSIEHFGGGTEDFQAAKESIRHQARIVKPGGVVFMTTELVITGQGDKLGNGWNRQQLEKAILHQAKAAGLELVEPINWSISRTSLMLALSMGTYGQGWRCVESVPHQIVCQGNKPYDPEPYSCWTSIALAFRKASRR